MAPSSSLSRPPLCPPQISNRHRFRLFHVLETVIAASDALEETWAQAFMKLALENMTKSTVGTPSHRPAVRDPTPGSHACLSPPLSHGDRPASHVPSSLWRRCAWEESLGPPSRQPLSLHPDSIPSLAGSLTAAAFLLRAPSAASVLPRGLPALGCFYRGFQVLRPGLWPLGSFPSFSFLVFLGFFGFCC